MLRNHFYQFKSFIFFHVSVRASACVYVFVQSTEVAAESMMFEFYLI